MEEKYTYNVLRLVTHGNRCYVSSDLIRGKPMIYWLKYHPIISKEQIYQWMLEIIQNLEAFHKCQGAPNYQYINPYSIIVSDEKKLYLLDLGNKKHEDLLHQMQRRMVREHFLSPENLYYQNNSEKEDIYSLGKILQYLMATAVIEPPLTWKEERQLQKIISKCLNKKSRRSYQKIQEISEHFPRKRESKTLQISNYGWKAIIGSIFVCLLIGNIVLVTKSDDKKEQVKEVTTIPPIVETKVEVKEKELSKEEKQAFYELGLCYLLDYEDADKSKEVFSLLENDELANDYACLVGQLKNKTLDDDKLYALLKELEERNEEVGSKGQYLAFIKGYEILEIEMAKSERERLYKKCLYEIDRDDILFWNDKKYDVVFRIELLRLKCGDPAISREACALEVQKMLEEMPELKNTEEFRKLQTEYEITFEEEKIWVKK